MEGIGFDTREEASIPDFDGLALPVGKEKEPGQMSFGFDDSQRLGSPSVGWNARRERNSSPLSFRADDHIQRKSSGMDLDPGRSRTRLGLPVTESSIRRSTSDRGIGSPSAGIGSPSAAKDPHYAARLNEILGIRDETLTYREREHEFRHHGYTASVPELRNKSSASAFSPSRTGSEWAGRRNDGAFDGRHYNAYAHVGDYASPAMYTTLMGVQSTASVDRDVRGRYLESSERKAAARVLPAAAQPFLKSVTANFSAKSSSSASWLGSSIPPVLPASYGFAGIHSRRASSPSPIRPTALSY